MIQRNAAGGDAGDQGRMDHDIIIVGAGPAGLALARSLRGAGFDIALIERQPREALADPAYDGREIALTHRSIRILQMLGAWARIPDMHPLASAQVLNGGSPLALGFAPRERDDRPLGMLVSNHLIRRALWDAAADQPGLSVLAGRQVLGASAGPQGCAVALDGGDRLTGRLLVAADSRFSATRDQLGIGAAMHRLGKAMLVCRVAHEAPHGDTATEWFEHGHTIALLPLGPGQSSAVLTVGLDDAERLRRLDDNAFAAEIAARCRHRLGAMRVASSRHVYPLVTSFSDRLTVPGAALIGDAAVGMHPVTAHGFNLGLSGQARLAREILLARRRGEDWAGQAALARFETAHRRACRPIFEATNAIVRLFTDERPPARLARHAVLRAGRRVPLARRAISAMLMRA
ncbi:5-demethoxyubiquinol-8 5-hydroxylase UbiM [Sphingomonas horti]|uniref:5-demethoxyubiquinol-8 5-hydroxylase UbiM n=1 Tax=Sphingomonas horti TaxID=2682842 RepID=UPI001E53A977|nr:5-demethoxyubiquinol-8 5-hydroxylase UbiM [Sphingomonas horti]